NGTTLLLLDDDGRQVGKGKRLLGVGEAWGVAVSGNEVGVLTDRVRDAPDPDHDGGIVKVADGVQFRPFDEAGTALGPGVCLDGASSKSQRGAITGEANGYAVVQRAATGAIKLLHFDRRGTGSQ